MHKYEHYYCICEVPDDDLFRRQCKALETYIAGLEPEPVLKDVDDSSFQIYHHPRGQIKVSNSYYLGELCVESDFDLLPYFEK
jgi:hypothetical protein